MKKVFEAISLAYKKEFYKKIQKFGYFFETEAGKHVVEQIQDSLYQTGTTASGIILNTDLSAHNKPYAANTIRQKKREGKPTDRVTLRDTGEFYKSISVKGLRRAFRISADFEKDDGNRIGDNFSRTFPTNASFERAVLELSAEELRYIYEKFVLPKILD